MKPQEILLASALIAVVSGVCTALATKAFEETPLRVEAEPGGEPRAALAERTPSGEDANVLDELRLENAALRARLDSLEARLGEASNTRAPLEPGSTAPSASSSGSEPMPARAAQALEVTPAFVASVGQALDTIKERERAELEKKRKEQQALRVEERLARLQQELGMSQRQTSDLRSVLLAQEEKRESIFGGLRDGLGERELRENFRALREETNASIQGILSPEQFDSFQRSEESEFGRRGFEPGPGRMPEDGFGRRRG